MIFILVLFICIIVMWIVWINRESLLWRVRGYIDPITGKDLRELGLQLFRIDKEVIIVDPSIDKYMSGDIVYLDPTENKLLWEVEDVNEETNEITLVSKFSINKIQGKVIGKEKIL